MAVLVYILVRSQAGLTTNHSRSRFLTRSAHAIGRHEDPNYLFSVVVTIQNDHASVVQCWGATRTRSREPAFVIQKRPRRRQTPSDAAIANNSFWGASVVSNRCKPGPFFAVGAVFSFSIGFADARKDNQDRQSEHCNRCGEFPNHVRAEFSCSLDLLKTKERDEKKKTKQKWTVFLWQRSPECGFTRWDHVRNACKDPKSLNHQVCALKISRASCLTRAAVIKTEIKNATDLMKTIWLRMRRQQMRLINW